MLKIFLLSLFIFFTALAGELQYTQVFPWRARLLGVKTSTWVEDDLKRKFPDDYADLEKTIEDMKFENGLNCQKKVTFTQKLRSLGNKEIKIQQRYASDRENNPIEIFEFAKGQDGQVYEVERLRFSHQVRKKDKTLGQLKSIKIMDLKVRVKAQPSDKTSGILAGNAWINANVLSFISFALIGKTTREREDSELAKEWTDLMQKADKAFACCMNRVCRTYFDKLKKPEPRGRVRRADLGPPSGA